MGLFLGSLSCSIDLYMCSCASARQFLLQWPYSIARYQEFRYLQLCSSFVRTFAEAIWGRFWFHVNFWSIFSSSLKYAIGILMGIALNVHIAFGRMAILIMLLLPIHEQGVCFHLFVSSLISFFSTKISVSHLSELLPSINQQMSVGKAAEKREP